MESNKITKALVKSILERANSYQWSLQGFGMLRLYLSDNLRLHVWHPDYAVKDVSTIHTHPWDFTSHVIAGRMLNLRYRVVESGGVGYKRQLIQCGPGGCAKGEPESVQLNWGLPVVYMEGETYSELAEEIHTSEPDAGTVTLIERKFKKDTEHAYVFYRHDERWVSAEPAPATPEIVTAITQIALRRYFC